MRRDVKYLQEFGNTLVALGLLRTFFCWIHEVEDIETGCTCGYCRFSRTIFSVSYSTINGDYYEDEVDI